MREVIKCHKAEMAGDYETAYKTLLNIVSKNVYGANAMSWSPSHNFTMAYNFPFECWGIMDSDARYAVAAVYNLYWMGFQIHVPILKEGRHVLDIIALSSSSCELTASMSILVK